MGIIKNFIMEKLNPAQSEILRDQGDNQTTTISSYTVSQSYEKVEVVQRGVNLTVDCAAGLKFDVQGKIRNAGIYTGKMGKAKLLNLINFNPNVYQSSDAFFRNIYLDILLEGNAFMYFDGVYLYHLPASNVEIFGDPKKYIKKYTYSNKDFSPDEIIHIKENSSRSIYRGDSRLKSSLETINTLYSMLSFQKNFFTNNAIPGIVLSTPNVLSDKLKNRFIQRWMQDYNPSRGGKRPMILDGEFKMENLGQTDFRELDFAKSIEIHEKKILKAIGVPPILLDSGNNANITPNLRLFYITTILPLVDKVCTALEFYFGHDLKPDKSNALALQPDLRDESAFYTAMTNAGILTRNEARIALRYEKSSDITADDLILPQNIAGSAVDPSQGGRPEEDKPK